MLTDLDDARILAIETSSRIGSAAVAQGRQILTAQRFTAGLKHGVELIPTIDALCRQVDWRARDIDCLFVSAGPGSFTGLRVGITFARTLAQVTDCLLVAVPTVDAIVENIRPLLKPHPGPITIAVILDAKRNQVYAAAFQWTGGKLHKTVEEHVVRPAELLQRLPQPIWVTGEGIDYHRQAVDQAKPTIVDKSYWPPKAENVHACGLRLARQNRFVQLEQLLPIYLRLPEAEERWRQRHGLDQSH